MQMYAPLMKYSPNYIQRLRRFNRFQVPYSIYWFSVNDAQNAQVVDLWYLKCLHRFKDVDNEMASACIETALNHLQYLAPEFCFLSLVSSSLPAPEKTQLAAAILASKPPSQDENGVPHFDIQAPAPIVTIEQSTEFSSITVQQLAGSPRVFLPFHLLKIRTDFLNKDPSEWSTDDNYAKLAQFVANLRVVNDTAERAVQLFSDYHGRVTKDERSRQCLMSTVIQQRREKSNLSRKALTDRFAVKFE